MFSGDPDPRMLVDGKNRDDDPVRNRSPDDAIRDTVSEGLAELAVPRQWQAVASHAYLCTFDAEYAIGF